MSSSKLLSVLLPIVWIAVACQSDALVRHLAIQTAAPKSPVASESELAARATRAFRAALYDADYHAIPEAQRLLTAAYLENPRDGEIALLLAHSHLWLLAERSRNEVLGEQSDPQITDHALLADHYFDEAGRLRPDDDRVDGWQGAVRLALGSIHADERSTREGYFQLRESVRAYPEFNGFSAAYPMADQPRESERFAEAIDWIWRNIETCSIGELNRATFDLTSFRLEGPADDRLRTCWNTTLVPHNIEGFFLVAGDMFTKAGDLASARRAYRVAQSVPSYSEWRYAPVLEARVAKLDDRAFAFTHARGAEEEPEMMFGSDYACTGCHAR